MHENPLCYINEVHIEDLMYAERKNIKQCFETFKWYEN
jgi:hypothetical protein